MTARKIPFPNKRHYCECSKPATHRIGADWECDDCRTKNSMVDHPQDHVCQFLPTDESLESEERSREYFRKYSKAFRERQCL